VVALRHGKKEMEEAVEVEGEAFRMVAGVRTFMREVRVELRVMDLVPAMVVIKGVMLLLMEFFGPDRKAIHRRRQSELSWVQQSAGCSSAIW
jgi:hypothetical protein